MKTSIFLVVVALTVSAFFIGTHSPSLAVSSGLASPTRKPKGTPKPKPTPTARVSLIERAPFPIAYITDKAGNGVLIIDASSNILISGTVLSGLNLPGPSITVGSNPVAVVVSPSGIVAYVANSGSNSVSVIDTPNQRVLATIPVAAEPSGLAISPSGRLVYVANHSGNSIQVIDTSRNVVSGTLNFTNNVGPVAVAINPAGTRLYVANETINTVSVIDTSTFALVATIQVSDRPFTVVVNSDGTRAYVADFRGHSVAVINTAGNAVVSTIKVGNPGIATTDPSGIALNPSGTRAYVATDEVIAVIDTSTNQVITNIQMPDHPLIVAVNPSGTRAYATLSGGGVQVIDVSSEKALGVIKTSPGVFAVAFK